MAVPFQDQTNTPLYGIRVLDLSRLVAGNVLTHVLADLGADVIKIEPPDGDALRAWKVEGVEVQWKIYARNKRSICINMKDAANRAILDRLIASAHVLLENYRPGVLDRLGYPLDRLHQLRPDLVVARISGWGATGPSRDKPGFGTLVEAASGYAAKSGFPELPPLLPNLGLADSVTGLYGAACVLAALRKAEGDGIGQELDLALFDSFLSILAGDQAIHHLTGRSPQREGNRSNLAAPRNVYGTSDGQYLALSASTPEMAHRLFDAIGRPEMKTDPRFADNPSRLRHVEALDAIIGDFIARRSLADNLAFFAERQITVGPINDAAAVMADRHVMERGSILYMEDDDVGALPMHAVPCRFSKTPGALRRQAPRLDQDREDILREMGLMAEGG